MSENFFYDPPAEKVYPEDFAVLPVRVRAKVPEAGPADLLFGHIRTEVTCGYGMLIPKVPGSSGTSLSAP